MRRPFRRSPLPNSDAVLARLHRLHPRSIDLSLGRIERLLARLDHPERRLPAVVHVAGTNGKGSVIAFVRAILEARGLRVHVYTSPHLVRFTERIVVAGKEIGDDHLIGLIEECERANGADPITFFEVTTAVAFLAFSRSVADVTLLETGLGGRLDATNVVRDPMLCVLTPISIDHQSYLGDTLDEIAGEKAGILKPGVRCVVARQQAQAEQVIRARAKAVGAPLDREGTHWSVRLAAGGLIFRDGERSIHLPAPALEGAHQVANAGVAVACVRRLAGLNINDAAIATGLRRAAWPARLQRLDSGRLRTLVPQGWEIWLDGGHNPAAGEALAQHVRTWRDRPLHLVYGGLKNKDARGMLTPLSPYVSRLMTVAIPGHKETCLSAEEAARIGMVAGLDGEPAARLEDALTRLAQDATTPARVLICGSLYLAGAVLAANDS